MRSYQPTPRSGLLVLLCLAAGASDGVSAGSGGTEGTYAFESLRRPSSAAGAVSGGALDCGAGPEAMRANPAALGAAGRLVWAASHQTWQGDLQEQWTGFSVPIPRGGLSIEASAYHAGSLEAFSEEGVPLGSFRPIEILAGLGAGFTVRPGLRVGLSAHGLYMGAEGEGLTGTSASAGLEFDLRSATVGVTARHFGPAPRGDLGDYRLPAEILLTARSDGRHRASVGFSGSRDLGGETRGSLASRVRLHGGLAVMAGMRYEGTAVTNPMIGTAGIEFQLGGLEVGYAFSPDDETGAGHVLSVRFARAALRAPSVPSTEGNPRQQMTPRTEAAGPARTDRFIDASPVAAPEPFDATTGPSGVASPPSVSGAVTRPQLAGPPDPSPSEAPSPSAAASAPPTQIREASPASTGYSVYAGIHRSAESAAAEVRALRFLKVNGVEVIARDDGTFWVLVARHLTREAAAALAHRLNATVEAE